MIENFSDVVSIRNKTFSRALKENDSLLLELSKQLTFTIHQSKNAGAIIAEIRENYPELILHQL